MELIQSFKYTTLYSSCLFHHTNQRIIFAVGTVFGQLILYEQDSNENFSEKTSVSDHNVNLNEYISKNALIFFRVQYSE